MADQYYRVFFYESEGGGPETRIYNCVNPHHALLKLLAYGIVEEAEVKFGCVYLGDWGFELKHSSQLKPEEKVIHSDDDILRIE